MGAKYPPEFSLPLYTRYGMLQFLMVSQDGFYVFAVRRQMVRDDNIVQHIRFYLLEINFHSGREEKCGCRDLMMAKAGKHAAGGGPEYISLEVDLQGQGLASVLCSLAVEEAFQRGKKEFLEYNPRYPLLWKNLGAVYNSEREEAVLFYSPPSPESKWIIANVCRKYGLSYIDLRALQLFNEDSADEHKKAELLKPPPEPSEFMPGSEISQAAISGKTFSSYSPELILLEQAV